MVIHLITLSALIAAVLLVRVVFRKKVPARLIYALWLVVAVKLCMPFALFEVEPTLPLADAAAQTEQTAVQTQNVPEVTKVPAVTVGAAITAIVSQQPIASQEAAAPPTAPAAPITPAEPIKPTVPVVPTVTEPTVVTPIETEVIAPEVPTVVEKSPIDWTHIAAIVWFVGSVAVAVWFAGTGAMFYQKLRADRCLHTTVGRTKVYISQSAGAPCLAGLLPAIYLTPSAAHSESKEFVIAHEYTHLRHGDHIWAALRTLALIVYWWNPLVWAAAIVSKQDAELACDEGVAAKLDDAGRIAYARTILDTIPQKHAHAVGLGSAPIKERLLMLTSKHKNRAVAAVLAVLLTLSAVGCSFIGPKETTEPADDTPDLPSSIATTSSDTTEVTTTADAVADTPDAPETPVRVLSNEGNVEIHTVWLPVANEDMQYRSFAYNERYSIYLTRDGQHYDDLHILDAQNGEIVYSYAMDRSVYYFYITYTDDGCILYGKTGTAVDCAFAVTEKDGVFSVAPTQMAAYPVVEQRLASPSEQYIVCETVDDAGEHGGVDVRYPDGSTVRILENIMLDDKIAGGAADIGDVVGYHPIGFVEDTKLVYRIGGWSGTKGYGIYDLTTGEKTEVFETGSNPCAVYDGAFYVEEWRSTMIVYEPEAVWKVTADGEKTKVASKDAADGVYVLSDDQYREFEHSMWCLFDTGNTAGIEYGGETPDTLTVSLYSPDFDKKLCEIEYPHGGSAFDNVRVYGNSVTVVVMSAPARTYAERPLVSQYAYTSVEDFYGPDAVYSMDLTGDGVADTCTVKVLGHGTQYYEEGITVADGQSGKTIAVGDPEFYTNHHILLSATEAMYTVGVGDMLYYIDKSRLDTPEEHRGEVLHGNDIIDFMVGDNALICRVSLACGMSEVCAELIYTYTYTAGEFAVTGVRLCDLTTDKEIDFGTFAPTAYLPTDLTDSITYIDIGGAYMPVSYIQSGKQLLTGDAVYSMLAGDVLKDAPTADSLPKQKNLASDASWDLFPVEVVHAVYTPEEQPEETEWIGYFAEQLAGKDTPVILTESWSFTLEGKKAAVVYASNVIVSGDQDVLYTAGDAHAAPNAPAADDTVLYRMQAFFIEGSKPQRLYSEIAVLSEDYGISYRPTAFESYQQIFSALQYDASGKIVECPLFNNMNGWYALRDHAYRPEYTVCDIDGDGAVELLCYTEKASSDMSQCSVYRLEDGICIRVCTVALS